MYNYTFPAGDDGANSMEPGGVLMLAQEQDSPWGDLEEVQSMTGYIDEFRVWSTVRTSAEIKANYKVREFFGHAAPRRATPRHAAPRRATPRVAPPPAPPRCRPLPRSRPVGTGV